MTRTAPGCMIQIRFFNIPRLLQGATTLTQLEPWSGALLPGNGHRFILRRITRLSEVHLP